MKYVKYAGLLAALVLSTITFQLAAQEDAEETSKWSFGADVRVRLTSIDRNVFNPDSTDDGPAVQYIRVRERLSAGYAFTEDVRFDLQLVNRWHRYSSNIGDPNNRDSATWEFPDEGVFDRFRLTWANIGDLPMDMVLGRQDIILGNGMLILEGTPFDAGRTIYYDGIRFDYRGEANTLTTFYVYQRLYDDFLIINDQHRQLRPGDWQIAGAYWTHKLHPSFNWDLYLFYADVNDTNFPIGDLEFLMPGARLFGDIPESPFKYSLEAATQRGKLEGDTDIKSWMVDARLDWFGDKESKWKPHAQLEYTWFSGNDPDSSDYEGFYPYLGSGYPIWREELMVNQHKGNWTNLHQYRIAADAMVVNNVKLTAQYHYMLADEPSAAGREIGHLYSMFIDYFATKNLTLRLEGSFFDPGDYYANGSSSEWLRFETVFKF